MKKECKSSHADPLYVYANFSIMPFYMTPSSSLQPTIVRIYNAFIEAMNTNMHLPDFVFIMADKDLISSLQFYDFNVCQLIQDNVAWLHRNILLQINCRRDDPKDKRIGAVNPTHTHIVWMKMIERPKTDNFKLKQILMLRGKYHQELEKMLIMGDSGLLMNIETVDEYTHFDYFGNLTEKGKEAFWENFNKQLKEFDFNIIKWNPLEFTDRLKNRHNHKDNEQNYHTHCSYGLQRHHDCSTPRRSNSPKHCRLPTPPPVRIKHRHHSTKRYRKY